MPEPYLSVNDGAHTAQWACCMGPIIDQDSGWISSSIALEVSAKTKLTVRRCGFAMIFKTHELLGGNSALSSGIALLAQ